MLYHIIEMNDFAFDDINDLINSLPDNERIRSLVRRSPYPVSSNSDTLSFIQRILEEDGITWQQLVDYGIHLPFSKRMIEGVLRGGRTLERTIQSDQKPSTIFHVCIQPGQPPRAATSTEIESSGIIIVNEPNTRTQTIEPARNILQILRIDIRKHVHVLQSHFGRTQFDVFARGHWITVDGIKANLSQLTVWCWMKRFAIHEYITNVNTQYYQRTSRRRPHRILK